LCGAIFLGAAQHDAKRQKEGDMDPDQRATVRAVKPIHLALQGGGAHGALTWGVLDRLLEDARLEVRAISGTSAGAMNAVVLADGLVSGGREGARAALRSFWTGVGEAGCLSLMRRGLWDRLLGRYSLDGSFGYLFLESLSRLVSPYELNPLGFDPLREILARHVDFDRVKTGGIGLHVAATNVRTGLPRIFSGDEVSADTVLASACLPQLYRAVEIDGEAYWDGGFTANPALFPLVEDPASRDIVIVQLNPAERQKMSHGARSIVDRTNEISFNAPLVKELRAIAWIQRNGGAGDLRLHRIDATAGMSDLTASSKLDAEWAYLSMLFERGRATADRWLRAHFRHLGKASSLDLATVGPLSEPAADAPTAARRKLSWPFATRGARRPRPQRRTRSPLPQRPEASQTRGS
jgi:NTE family protein